MLKLLEQDYGSATEWQIFDLDLDAGLGGALPVTEKSIFIIIACLCTFGCTTPSANFAGVAADLGFNRQLIDTEMFRHQIFLNAEAEHGENQTSIHVYLDGDGTPWEYNRSAARDPTSRNPMILRLMQQDKRPAILLGRPCYHGLNESVRCHSKYWTSHRYSPHVVASMTLALNQWLREQAFDNVVLIGFSGGGVLALLMAPEIPSIETVVTIAANLDVDKWSRHHGYMPLHASLNPADQAMNLNIQQIHIAGADDDVVPPFIIESYANKQINALYLSIPAQNHYCCWAEIWPSILNLF